MLDKKRHDAFSNYPRPNCLGKLIKPRAIGFDLKSVVQDHPAQSKMREPTWSINIFAFVTEASIAVSAF